MSSHSNRGYVFGSNKDTSNLRGYCRLPVFLNVRLNSKTKSKVKSRPSESVVGYDDQFKKLSSAIIVHLIPLLHMYPTMLICGSNYSRVFKTPTDDIIKILLLSP